jgi:hypothetical protein
MPRAAHWVRSTHTRLYVAALKLLARQQVEAALSFALATLRARNAAEKHRAHHILQLCDRSHKHGCTLVGPTNSPSEGPLHREHRSVSSVSDAASAGLEV